LTCGDIGFAAICKRVIAVFAPFNTRANLALTCIAAQACDERSFSAWAARGAGASVHRIIDLHTAIAADFLVGRTAAIVHRLSARIGGRRFRCGRDRLVPYARLEVKHADGDGRRTYECRYKDGPHAQSLRLSRFTPEFDARYAKIQ
jgi:hypothetical protein